ncbi:hypothetical protein AAIR98_000126 [Elusimicrobium simillimum]|uniref:hypothetical protein n=1 Tax=Elusimicrobium simillimum TaxID=3143438 RepID=UPI003C6FF26A
MLQHLFGFIPDDLKIEFKPLRILSAQQQEEVKNQQFQRVSAAVQSGIMTLKKLKAINRENLLPIKIQEDDLVEIPEANAEELSKNVPGITLTKPRYNNEKKSLWEKLKERVNAFKEDEHPETVTASLPVVVAQVKLLRV